MSLPVKALIPALLVIVTAGAARAEMQTEITNQARLALWFKISDQKVQDLIPAGWTSNPAPGGANAGANLGVVLIDSHLSATEAGGPAPNAPTNRFLVLAMPAMNTASGKPETLIVGGYLDDAAGAPGYYQNYLAGSVAFARTEIMGGGDPPRSLENWIVSGPDGGAFDVTAEWTPATPGYSTFDQTVVSATATDRIRFYRGHQGVDVVMSGPLAVDKGEVIYNAGGGLFGKVFDGSETLISVLHLPWYFRETFVP